MRRSPLVLAALIGLSGCGGLEIAQDQEHYRHALADTSTSPYFVLVTIKDDASGASYTGCIPANFLKGALFRELGGDWGTPPDPEKRQAALALLRKAGEIAAANTDHLFHFSNPAALDTVKLRYTESDLTEARKVVLSAGVKSLGLGPGSLDRRSLGKLQWNDALACAIIEQGASARKADMTGQIYAEP